MAVCCPPSDDELDLNWNHRGEVLDAVSFHGCIFVRACAQNEEWGYDEEIILAAINCDRRDCGGGRLLPFARILTKPIVLAAVSKDSIYLKGLPEKFTMDRDVIRAAISSGKTYTMDIAPQEFLRDREIVLEACQYSENVLIRTDKDIRQDRDFVLKVLRTCPIYNIYHIDAIFFADKEVVLATIANNGGSIHRVSISHTSKKLLEDRDVALAAVTCYPRALQILTAFQDDEEIVSVAVRKILSVIRYASERFRQNRKLILSAIPTAQDASLSNIEGIYDYRNDYEMIMEFVSRRGCDITYLPISLQHDPKILMAALRNTGRSLMMLHPPVDLTREMILAGVSSHGGMISLPIFDESNLRSDPEIMKLAVTNHPAVLEYAHASIKDMKEIVLIAVRKNGDTLEFASDRLKGDIEVVSAAVNNDPRCFLYASPTILSQYEYQKEFIRRFPRGAYLLNCRYPINQFIRWLSWSPFKKKWYARKRLIAGVVEEYRIRNKYKPGSLWFTKWIENDKDF